MDNSELLHAVRRCGLGHSAFDDLMCCIQSYDLAARITKKKEDEETFVLVCAAFLLTTIAEVTLVHFFTH